MRRAAIIVGGWTLVVVLDSINAVLPRLYADQPADWARQLWASSTYWYSVAVFTPLFIWLVRTWPMGRGGWLKTAAVYVGALSVIAVLRYSLFVPLRQLFYAHDGDLTIAHMLKKSFFFELVSLGTVVGIVQAFEYARSLRERELRAAQLEARLSEAQLEALRSELQPHFFFNALHSVSTLMHENIEAADEMLGHLGDLLRLSLEQRRVHEIALKDELEVLEHYLKIVRIRFGDRLTIVLHADPALMHARVPVFILQPLVENAIRHGIGRRAGSGRIEVSALHAGERIALAVTDDGPGVDVDGVQEGIGLSNCRRRLEQLYGRGAELTMKNGSGQGTTVTVFVPFVEAPEATAG
jgi:LytS/YehU family sensor histidine kinase